MGGPGRFKKQQDDGRWQKGHFCLDPCMVLVYVFLLHVTLIDY